MKGNKNYRVFRLVISCFAIYFAISIFSSIADIKWKPINNISLVSEIFKPKRRMAPQVVDTILAKDNAIIDSISNVVKVQKDFGLYHQAETITDFIVDPQNPALPNFADKLSELLQTKKGKIRIAYFGDSMIEGDLFTKTLRELLQEKFGGEGVGFVPIYSKIAGFRTTVFSSGSGWKDIHFKDKNAENLYISGHLFTGSGVATFEDKTIKNNGQIIEKSLITGKLKDNIINYNGNAKTLNGSDYVNRIVLAKDSLHRFKINSPSPNLPLYGISFESENGIFVDNFSFRGITGVELGRVEDKIMQAIQKNNPYDLIVLQYGVNLLFSAKNTKFARYENLMPNVLEKLKNNFKGADFLLISTADRAFRYNGEYKTAVGVPFLIEIQAKLAMDHDFSFYNQFESMGGENSIVKWANQKPSLANKDYIHPNHRGAAVLAEKLYHAMMKDYDLLNKNKSK